MADEGTGLGNDGVLGRNAPQSDGSLSNSRNGQSNYGMPTHNEEDQSYHAHDAQDGEGTARYRASEDDDFAADGGSDDTLEEEEMWDSKE